MSTHNLKPLSEVIKDLKDQGYTADYIFRNEKLYNTGTKQFFEANDITVTDEYRFEGDTDPADMSILYAIEISGGEKGTLVDSYGADSNTELEDFLNGAHFSTEE